MVKIIHLSDVHLPCLGDRRYNSVESANIFEEFGEQIRRLKESLTYLKRKNGKDQKIVITGDIFDVKDKYRIETLNLFKELIEIATIFPTYIIRGNHDYQQVRGNRSDLLGNALLFVGNEHNCHYLDTTTVFDFDNVSFGLVVVQDILDGKATAGNAEKLTPFPKPPQNQNVKIALAHTSLAFQEKDQITTEWFKEWDYALLGDDHGMQINNASKIEHQPKKQGKWLIELERYELIKGKTYGYPGSFVQLNKGEDLIGHGFLYWDFDNGIVSKFHLLNEYGFYDPATIKNINKVFIPTHNKFVGKSINLNYNHETDPNGLSIINSNDDQMIQGIININLNFIKKHWKPNLITIQNELPNDLVFKAVSDQIQTQNDDLQRFINEKITPILQEATTNKNRLTLHQIEWQWVLCYGEGNKIDFQKCPQSGITLISGRNGSGKSSFYEIILMGMFGETCQSRIDTGHSGDFVNKNWKPSINPRPFIKTIFTINGELYKIERCFRTQKDNRILQKEGEKLYHYTTPQNQSKKDFVLVFSGKQVNKWVSEKIGNINQFLLGNMLTQNDDQDFLEKKPQEQKKIINEVFGIEVVSQIQDLLKTSYTKHNTAKNNISKLKFNARNPQEEGLELFGYEQQIQYHKNLLDEEMELLNGMPKGQKFSIDPEYQDELKLSTLLDEHRKKRQWLNSFDGTKLYKYEQIEKEYKGVYKPKSSLYDQLKIQGYELQTIEQLQETLFEENQIVKKCQLQLDTNQKHQYTSNNLVFDRSEKLQQLKLQISEFKMEHDTKPKKPVYSPPEQKATKPSDLPKDETINDIDISELCSQQQYIKKKQQYEQYKRYVEKHYGNKTTIPKNVSEKKIQTIIKQFNQYDDEYKNVTVPIQTTKTTNANQSQVSLKECFSEKVQFNEKCSACANNILNDTFEQNASGNLSVSEKDNLRIYTVNQWKQKYDQIQQDYQKYQHYDKYIELQKLQQETEEMYQKYILKEYIEERKEFLKYEQEYERRLSEYIEQLKLYNEERKIFNDLQKEYDEAYSQHQMYLQHEIQKHQEKILFINEVINAKRYDLKTELMTVLSEEVQMYKRTQTELERHDKNILGIQYEDYQEQLEKIKTIHNTLTELNHKHYKWNEIKLYNEKQQELQNVTKQFIIKLEQKMEKLKMEQEQVKTFHDQQYEKIKRTFQDETNTILKYMTNDDFGIYVDPDYNILFKKGNISHTIFKASGFQKFACGLGMRTVLGKVQSLQSNQLFIDEGFVACDTINLENAQYFLEEIGKYYQVFMVSHLDTLRDCADKTLYITTDENTKQQVLKQQD